MASLIRTILILILLPELRKTTLHLPVHLLRRRWHGRGHRIHHLAHLLQSRTALPVHRATASRRDRHDHAKTTPLPPPRPHRRLPCRRRRGPNRRRPVHRACPRLDRQTPLRNHGIRQSRGHGRLRDAVEEQM
jgi:hypothetical protein